jgi:hypothetical protein
LARLAGIPAEDVVPPGALRIVTDPALIRIIDALYMLEEAESLEYLARFLGSVVERRHDEASDAIVTAA